jgi:hypothetical protein
MNDRRIRFKMISVQLTNTVSQSTAKLQQIVENLSVKIEIPSKCPALLTYPTIIKCCSSLTSQIRRKSHQYAFRELHKTTCKNGISQVEGRFHQSCYESLEKPSKRNPVKRNFISMKKERDESMIHTSRLYAVPADCLAGQSAGTVYR